jgi:hypothetical protein
MAIIPVVSGEKENSELDCHSILLLQDNAPPNTIVIKAPLMLPAIRDPKLKEPGFHRALCCTNRFRNIVDIVIYHVL